MAHSEIPADKIEAYLKTDYRFGEGSGAVTLRIDQGSDELAQLFARSGFACGVFITAYNPFGRAQDAESNEIAHQALGAELRALSAQVIEGAGTDPVGKWPPEKSFFALGIDLDKARYLGNRYRQDAIVWVGVDAVAALILLR